MAQDVIAFPAPAPLVDERKLDACLMVSPIAEMLYHARCLWIGGEALPWKDLTPQQKYGYRVEVETLIKEQMFR